MALPRRSMLFFHTALPPTSHCTSYEMRAKFFFYFFIFLLFLFFLSIAVSMFSYLLYYSFISRCSSIKLVIFYFHRRIKYSSWIAIVCCLLFCFLSQSAKISGFPFWCIPEAWQIAWMISRRIHTHTKWMWCDIACWNMRILQESFFLAHANMLAIGDHSRLFAFKIKLEL